MTRKEVDAAALALPATAKVVQWGNSDVYKVAGRVFAICTIEGSLSFKVTDIGFVALTEGGPGRQAPYLAKGGWVAVEIDAAPDADILDWLATSYGMIAAKLTRKARTEAGLA